jgi:phenylacetate-CoA ligase
LALIYVLREQTGIESFKVTQRSRRLTEVQLVTAPGFQPATISLIEAGFRRRLGNAVDVRVSIVDEIPAELSGKYRYIVSHALGEEEARSDA